MAFLHGFSDRNISNICLIILYVQNSCLFVQNPVPRVQNLFCTFKKCFITGK